MTTIESVCNQALDVLGYPRHIGNIWEGTKAARVALDCWWETRDALLSATKPEWARKDAVLVQLRAAPTGAYGPGVPWTTAYPPIPWLYEYTLPTDCLVPLQIKTDPTSLPIWRPRPNVFRMHNDITGNYTLLTNTTPAVLSYVARILDPTQWYEEFTELMVQALAKKFAAGLGARAPQEQKDADQA